MDSDDLFKAFSMFQGGLRDLAFTKALTGANEQVAQIKDSTLNEAQQMQQLRNVAQGLTFKMAGMGVPASTMEAVIGATAPKPPTVQTAEQAMIMGSPDQQKSGQNVMKMEFEHKQKLEQMKLDAAAAMFGKKKEGGDDKTLLAQQDIFRTKYAKAQFDALDQTAGINNLLAKGDNNAAFQAAMRGIIKLGGDNKISDFDVKSANPDPSAAAETRRTISRLYQGKPLASDISKMKDVVGALTSAARGQLKDKAQNFAQSRKGLISETPDKFYGRLMAGAFGGVDPTGGPAGDLLATFPQYATQIQAARQSGHSDEDITAYLKTLGQ